MNKVVIVIPAYNPSNILEHIVKELTDEGYKIVVVNDGSDLKYKLLFDTIEKNYEKNVKVLNHDKNIGKGAAIKTAFSFVNENYSDCIGIVTADADGQHLTIDIIRVSNELNENNDCLVLAQRSFSNNKVPWKSYVGNTISSKLLEFAIAVKIEDTQCGLRGIPKELFNDIIELKYNGYELEMKFLINVLKKVYVRKVSIETIYFDNNKNTHFNAIIDTLKVVRVLGGKFFKFLGSSLFCWMVDITIFWLMSRLLSFEDEYLTVLYATLIARIMSILFNYIINRGFVFKYDKRSFKTLAMYLCLAIVLIILSSTGVYFLSKVLCICSKVTSKMIVDSILFFLSFKIQNTLIFIKEV